MCLSAQFMVDERRHYIGSIRWLVYGMDRQVKAIREEVAAW